jgi:hypothetical protein
MSVHPPGYSQGRVGLVHGNPAKTPELVCGFDEFNLRQAVSRLSGIAKCAARHKRASDLFHEVTPKEYPLFAAAHSYSG